MPTFDEPGILPSQSHISDNEWATVGWVKQYLGTPQTTVGAPPPTTSPGIPIGTLVDLRFSWTDVQTDQNDLDFDFWVKFARTDGAPSDLYDDYIYYSHMFTGGLGLVQDITSYDISTAEEQIVGALALGPPVYNELWIGWVYYSDHYHLADRRVADAVTQSTISIRLPTTHARTWDIKALYPDLLPGGPEDDEAYWVARIPLGSGGT